MTTFLLDANVLIALTVAEHEHHDRASTWAAGAGSLAVCPIVEGALTRFLVRLGETAWTAQEVLRTVRGYSRVEFWPDALSYADADLSNVHGHRQVTDAYLVALASSHSDSRLVTLDRALSQANPDVVAYVD